MYNEFTCHFKADKYYLLNACEKNDNFILNSPNDKSFKIEKNAEIW